MDKKWINPLLFLIFLIVVCAAFSRRMSSGETLSEYAENLSGSGDITSPASIEENAADPTGSPAPSAGEAAATVSPTATPSPEPVALSFYYEPLSEEIIARITGISYPVSTEKAADTAIPAVNILAENETPAISYEELRYVSLLYYDFNGEVQHGELICNKGLAQDMLEIFYELYQNEYQLESVKLIDEFNGDDTASMAANNTSCFNYRVVDGTESLSKHALGCAIDVNPFYNPYVVFNHNGSGETYISPPGSEIYADRSQDFPYKIDENDLCYKLFTEHGFIWGGNWNSTKDYQHFQKVVD